MEEKRIFVGNRYDFEIRNNINGRIKSLRDYILGRQGHWEFLKLADYEEIFSNGGANVIDSYKKDLERQKNEIQAYGEKWYFEEGIPNAVKHFTEHLRYLKQAYDFATEFVSKEAFKVKQLEHGFTLDVDSKLVGNAIGELSKVYAVTPKQKKLYDIAKNISELLNEAKELTGNPMFLLLDIVKNTGEINTESIYHTFNNL